MGTDHALVDDLLLQRVVAQLLGVVLVADGVGGIHALAPAGLFLFLVFGGELHDLGGGELGAEAVHVAGPVFRQDLQGVDQGADHVLGQGVRELGGDHHLVVLHADHGVDGRPSDEDAVQDRGEGVDVGPRAGCRLDTQLFDGGVAREHFGGQAAVDGPALRDGEVGDADFMVGVDVQRGGGDAAVDDAVLVQGGQGGQDGHEEDARLVPGQIALLGGEQVVPQGLGAFHIFTDDVCRVVFFEDLLHGDEGGEAVHLLQLAPEFLEASQKAVVQFLRAGTDGKVSALGPAFDEGVRQELADGDRSLVLSIVTHIGGAVAVRLRDRADEVMASDHGAHGEERGQLQGIVMEMAVGALFGRALLFHTVHAKILV